MEQLKLTKKGLWLEYTTTNPGQTKKIGQTLSSEILNMAPPEQALILALKGDLGGGKTTLIQGMAKGLGIKNRILSPTFVILKKFKITKTKNKKQKTKMLNFKNFYHIDCYRIPTSKEILELGWSDIASNPQNIVAIEWAERIKKLLPPNIIVLTFDFINQNTRKIKIKGLN